MIVQFFASFPSLDNFGETQGGKHATNTSQMAYPDGLTTAVDKNTHQKMTAKIKSSKCEFLYPLRRFQLTSPFKTSRKPPQSCNSLTSPPNFTSSSLNTYLLQLQHVLVSPANLSTASIGPSTEKFSWETVIRNSPQPT